MRGRLAAIIALKASGVSLYQQCFGPWRGALLNLLLSLFGGYFRSHAVKAFVPGSRRSFLVRLGTSDVMVFKTIFYDEEYEWDFTDPPSRRGCVHRALSRLVRGSIPERKDHRYRAKHVELRPPSSQHRRPPECPSPPRGVVGQQWLGGPHRSRTGRMGLSGAST
jgi:hypothetical protein